MDGFASSTIAALCYAEKSGLDLHEIAREIGRVLWDSQQGQLRIDSSWDDVVICDLPGLRICLAQSDLRADFAGGRAVGPWAECLMVSVGSSPDPFGAGVPPPDWTPVCLGLAGHVEARARPDRVLVFDRAGVFTEETFDNLTEEIWAGAGALGAEAHDTGAEAAPPAPGPLGHAAAAAASSAAADDDDIIDLVAVSAVHPSAGRPAQPVEDAEVIEVIPAARRFDSAVPDDMLERLTRRCAVETRLREQVLAERAEAARAGGRAERVAARPRKLTPRATHPAAAADGEGARARAAAKDVSRLRRALYPDGEPDDPRTQPLVHRAAVNALNASMLAFVLPVGAALLTMAVFGREDLGTSSRVTALTGAAIGLAQSDAAMGLFAALG